MTDGSLKRFARLMPVAAGLLTGQFVYSQGEGGIDVASLSLDELMGIEVTTPSKVPEAVRDVPASVYLVSRDDIEVYGYQTLTEVFENVPGFYNIDNYTGVSGNFGIRGFWNSRSQNSSVAILVNGVPQSRVDIWSNPMESLNVPVEAIDRVEVIRGPNSVIYGNGASFGAINIITNDSYTEDLATVSYGGYGSKSASLRLTEFGEEFHVILNAGVYETRGMDHDLRDLVGPQNEALLPFFGVTDENASLDGKLEQSYHQIQLSAEWRDLYFELTRNESDVETYSGYPALMDGNMRESDNTRITVGADVSLGGEYRLDTYVSRNSFESGEMYDALYEGFEGFHGIDYDSWEIESLLSYVPSKDFSFIAGVNFQRMENYEEYTNVPALSVLNERVQVAKRDTRSLFTQINYQINPHWRVVAGYRIEELKPHGRRISSDAYDTIFGVKGGHENGTPRVSLIYQPSESQVFKLMAGDAVKFPSFTDLRYPSEKVRTIEANYTFSKERMLLSGSFFVNSHRDLMTEELRFLNNGMVDSDLVAGGELDTTGIELLANFELAEGYRAEVGATYQSSDYSFHPMGLASYSPELVAHGKLFYKRDHFSMSGLVRYVDGMYSYYNVNEDESADRPDGFFGAPASGYFVADANLRWDKVWKDVFVSLHVDNLFDETVWYPNNPVNGRFLDEGNLGRGRMFSVKLGTRF